MGREQEAKLAKHTNHLPELFADRLPATDMDNLRSMAGGGEWGLMLDELLASLRVRQAPITAAELDELRDVLSGWSLPTDQLRILLVAGDLPLEQL